MVQHAKQVRANSQSDPWLHQMKVAHAELLNAIGELDRLTRGPLPAKSVLVAIRWKVSKASLSRRMLWVRIHAHLSALGDRRAHADLRNLQEVDIRLMRASAEHVGQWTTEGILRNWPGYCQASERMRNKMIEAVMGEKRLLYPILEALDEAHPPGK